MRSDPSVPRRTIKAAESALGGTLHVAGEGLGLLAQHCSVCGLALIVRPLHASGPVPAQFPVGARVALSRIDGDPVAWPYTTEPQIGVWRPCT